MAMWLKMWVVWRVMLMVIEERHGLAHTDIGDQGGRGWVGIEVVAVWRFVMKIVRVHDLHHTVNLLGAEGGSWTRAMKWDPKAAAITNRWK